jgi:ATP-dependent 26S proteasome regulatory subunit
MNFSEEYLYEAFRTNYADAVEFEKRGNLPLAKQKFYKAAEYMQRLTAYGTDEKKAERAALAERLLRVADGISVNSQNNYGGGAQGDNINSSGGSGDTESGMEQFFEFYTADELKEGFEGVVGLESAKQAITDYLIYPIKYPEAFNYDFLDNKAVLLEGPPGTGKTTFAKAVAKEINMPFALVNVAALVNCFVGETGKNIDKVFAYLRDYTKKNNCGVIIFFDELDEIAKKRGSDDKTSEAAVPALLRNMDGVKNNKGFLILANTNRKDMLDAAIAQRFRKLIYIPLPDEKDRKLLFEKKTAEVEESFKQSLNYDNLSALSQGLSGRDITYICDDMKRLLAKHKAGIIEKLNLQQEVEKLISERKASSITDN